MKLMSWNVNGVRSAHAKGLVSVLGQERPDILCLQEVKADESHINGLAGLPELGTWSCSIASKRGYSGVATAAAAALRPTREAEIGRTGNTLLDSEGRWIISHFKEFSLYNMYFPSGTTGETRQTLKYRFLELFSRHLTSLSAKERARLVICGDLNICHREIDIHHPKEATKRQLSGFLPEERRWMESLVELGFVDTFRHVHGDTPHRYSWWSFRAGSRKKNLGWRIDYFFVSKELRKYIQHADIHEGITGSDHCPITLTLSV